MADGAGAAGNGTNSSTSTAPRTVLVIDDDAAVQRVARRVLERAGYAVLVASDGAAGVESFRGHRDDVVCALVDLSMPVMSGEETLAALRAMAPALPAVLASGYNEQHLQDAMVRAPHTAFVQKPFSADQLVGAVASVIQT